MNTTGTAFRVTTFGESHGAAVGAVIDGCPAGLEIDQEALSREMARRRPGQSKIVTQRQEADEVQILSGFFEGRTTGTPLTLLIENQDAKSKDYEHLRHNLRPGHADLTYHLKYAHRDHRGGGRSSARVTAPQVAAGAVARQLLKEVWPDFEILAWTESVGEILMPEGFTGFDLQDVEANDVRCPHPEAAVRMEELIREVRKAGDTVGGVVGCRIWGVPPGVGEPVFGKLHALLGAAVLGINACKGFEIGSGFAGTRLRGSTHNDLLAHAECRRFRTRTNQAGGVLGGISTGEDIHFRAAFKPVATLMRDQLSVDTEGNPVIVSGRGRHDPCVLPRAVPILEAVACLVLADLMLMARGNGPL